MTVDGASVSDPEVLICPVTDQACGYGGYCAMRLVGHSEGLQESAEIQAFQDDLPEVIAAVDKDFCAKRRDLVLGIILEPLPEGDIVTRNKVKGLRAGNRSALRTYTELSEFR